MNSRARCAATGMLGDAERRVLGEMEVDEGGAAVGEVTVGGRRRRDVCGAGTEAVAEVSLGVARIRTCRVFDDP